jgi:hypothetical protein
MINFGNMIVVSLFATTLAIKLVWAVLAENLRRIAVALLERPQAAGPLIWRMITGAK